MTHYFSKYLLPEMRTIELTIEKSTKAEIKRVLEVIESYKKIGNYINCFKINIDNLDIKKLGELTEIFVKNAIEFENGNYNFIILGEDSSDEYPPCEDQDRIERILAHSGFVISDSMSEEFIFAVIDIYNRKQVKLMREVISSNEFYQSIINSSRDTSNEKVKFVKKYNFKTYNSSLLSVYDKCFDPRYKILEKFFATNPHISWQRDLVWDEDKKVDFIDSIVNDIPIGSFYINENFLDLELGEGYGHILWDGTQRMHALYDFMCNRFSVQVNDKNLYYSDAPSEFTRLFNNTMVNLYQSQYTKVADIIAAYIQINKKQVRHTDSDFERALEYLMQNS